MIISNPKYSLEIFPPKSMEKTNDLINNLNHMVFPPEFISVTYGAGGSNQHATVDLIKRLHNETNINIAAHLTMVNSSTLDVINLIKLYDKLGIKKIVALRGDPPEGIEKPYKPYINGFQKTVWFFQTMRACSPPFDRRNQWRRRARSSRDRPGTAASPRYGRA